MTEMNIDSLNIAAIDVGSNAARLLIKHIDIDLDGNQTIRKSLLYFMHRRCNFMPRQFSSWTGLALQGEGFNLYYSRR